MILVDADDKWDLLRRMPSARFVLSHGRVVAETKPAETLARWNAHSGLGDGTNESNVPARIDFRIS